MTFFPSAALTSLASSLNYDWVNQGNINMNHGTGLLTPWTVSCYSRKKKLHFDSAISSKHSFIKNGVAATNTEVTEAILGYADLQSRSASGQRENRTSQNHVTLKAHINHFKLCLWTRSVKRPGTSTRVGRKVLNWFIWFFFYPACWICIFSWGPLGLENFQSSRPAANAWLGHLK